MVATADLINEEDGRARIRNVPLLHLFILLVFANALFTDLQRSIEANGFAWSVYATFEISIVKWAAMWFVFEKFRIGNLIVRSTTDWLILGLTGVCICVPISGMTWVGATIASIHFLATKQHDEEARRGLWVLLALCFSGVWSRLLARLVMEHILSIDALLVAALTGTSAQSNLLFAADGVTTLVVTEGCSSFTNISVAFLAWVLARSWFGTRGFLRSAFFVCVAGVLVVLINTIRIGVIALWPSYYSVAHGPVGANIASMATTIAVGIVAYLGAKK